MFDWNDLRHFLAVARTGSTLAGARELGVNQSTTARRVAALEAALGLALFERRQSGYLLTEAGQGVLEAAERVEQEAAALVSAVAAQARRVSGTIRMTTNEALANGLVVPLIREFRMRYPEVKVEVIVADRRLDIGRGEADVALRAGSRPDGGRVVARRFPDIGWSVFCSRDYGARHGIPRSVADLNSHILVGGEGVLAASPFSKWIVSVAPDAAVECRSNSLTNQISAVKAGLGIAPLPCLVAYYEPDLVQCLPPIEGLNSEFWLIVHEDLKNVSYVRAYLDFLTAHLTALTPMIKGKQPEGLGEPA